MASWRKGRVRWWLISTSCGRSRSMEIKHDENVVKCAICTCQEASVEDGSVPTPRESVDPLRVAEIVVK